jgi:hypothetical protein
MPGVHQWQLHKHRPQLPQRRPPTAASPRQRSQQNQRQHLQPHQQPHAIDTESALLRMPHRQLSVCPALRLVLTSHWPAVTMSWAVPIASLVAFPTSHHLHCLPYPCEHLACPRAHACSFRSHRLLLLSASPSALQPPRFSALRYRQRRARSRIRLKPAHTALLVHTRLRGPCWYAPSRLTKLHSPLAHRQGRVLPQKAAGHQRARSTPAHCCCWCWCWCCWCWRCCSCCCCWWTNTWRLARCSARSPMALLASCSPHPGAVTVVIERRKALAPACDPCSAGGPATLPARGRAAPYQNGHQPT